MPTTYGKITTFAGTGIPGYAGDNGPAQRAALHEPFYCVFDAEGDMFVAESGNNVVRRIDRRADHHITTIAGTGRKGYGGDNGPALRALFDDLVSLAVTDNGDIYVVDRLNSRVRKIDARSNIVTTVAGDGIKGYGGDGGPGDKARLREPHDCVLDGKYGLLIDDVADRRVRRLDLKTGAISTFAGTGQRIHSGDGGPAATASFAGPRALAVDSRAGTVFVVEREGNTIRRIDGRTGIVTLYAGTGKKGYTGDGGPAHQATFNGPKSLCCDPASGDLFVMDTENHAVRRIDAATGIITTVAGGHKGADGDGGPAIAAGLNRPHGATIGPDRALYIADTENNRIRRVEAIKG